MELKQLRHFIAIVEHGSFSKAAKAVAISQPALTRSIKQLEERLGVLLFNRSTRSVTPTQAGTRLYKRGKLIVREADDVVSDLSSQLQTDRPLRIGTAPMFATTIIPKAIQEFSSRFPDIEVNVVSGLFETLTDRLAQADLDVVVSNLPYGALKDDLIGEYLFDIDVVYAASVNHPLARAKKVDVSELFEFPWAVVDENHANDLYMNIFANQGGQASPIRVRTNSLNLLKSLIETPPWITLLPTHIVHAEMERGLVCSINVDADKVRRKGGLVYRRSQSDDPNIQRFAGFVRDAYQTAN